MSPFRDGLFHGRTAFVAGGTSGINLGIAARLAELGARVVVAGRNIDRAAAAAVQIGGEARGVSCDVRDYAAVRAALATMTDDWGPLDIVIAGAAGNFLATAASLSANGFRTVVDIDLNGTFNVFRASHDLLRKPGASLIAVTAGQAVTPVMLQAHACAAKAGVNQLVRVLAMEWGREGVRVNAICPGPINGTEGMARLAQETGPKIATPEQIPLRRFGEIWEVAEAAVFLCSSAAAYVTGAVLDCDGGQQLGDARDGLLER